MYLMFYYFTITEIIFNSIQHLNRMVIETDYISLTNKGLHEKYIKVTPVAKTAS